VTTVVRALVPEDHGDGDDEVEEDPAGDAQRAGGEVPQPGQQAAGDQQEGVNDEGSVKRLEFLHPG
jgi:hypothetical protein